MKAELIQENLSDFYDSLFESLEYNKINYFKFILNYKFQFCRLPIESNSIISRIDFSIKSSVKNKCLKK